MSSASAAAGTGTTKACNGVERVVAPIAIPVRVAHGVGMGPRATRISWGRCRFCLSVDRANLVTPRPRSLCCNGNRGSRHLWLHTQALPGKWPAKHRRGSKGA